MNCPECGRFMTLMFASRIDRDPDEAAFWWVCTNPWDCLCEDRGDHIPSPDHDWLYWCSDIPQYDLDEDPELRKECNTMKHQYLNRQR